MLSSRPALSRRALRLSAVGALVVAGLAVPHTASAAVTMYHVDPSGNDANPGTSAQPFQHIQKCADVMIAGDTCLIGTGRYRETVTPVASGTATAPITYAAETGATVTVDGSDPVPNAWSQVTTVPDSVNGVPDSFLKTSPFSDAVATGKVFSTQVPIAQPVLGNTLGEVQSSNEPPPQVFYNGVMKMPAQWPAATQDPMHPTIAAGDIGTTLTTIANPKLAQTKLADDTGYWVGAKAYVMASSWSQTEQVVASRQGTLTVCCTVTEASDNLQRYLPEGTAWPFTSGGNGSCIAAHLVLGAPLTARFFLYDKLELLAGPGDWFYDKSSQTLFFYSPTGSAPASGAVAVKSRQLAFDLAKSNIDYTKITGVDVFGSTLQTGSDSWGNVLDDLDVNYPSYFTDMNGDPRTKGSPNAQDCMTVGATTTGVMLRGHENVLQNSTVSNSAGNGVMLDSTPPCTLQGCAVNHAPEGSTVTNTVISNVGFAGAYPTAGVYPIGDKHHIEHNTITGCGQACIELQSYMQNSTISYNDISHFGRFRLDGGGIYSIGANDFTGTRVDHNWVHDAEPMEGIVDPATNGIYFDADATGVQIDNNVGWNLYKGLLGFVGKAHAIKVYNNTGPGFIHVQSGCVTEPTVSPVTGAVTAPGVGCSEFKNNLGFLRTSTQANAASDPAIIYANNKPAEGPSTLCNAPDPTLGVPNASPCPSVNALFVDPRVHDYRLQAGSPARNAGVVIPGVTDGSTDATPSVGAYQYGATPWVPGATSAPSNSDVVLHYSSTGFVSNSGWNHPQGASRPYDDPSRTVLALYAPQTINGGSADIKLGFINPVSNASDPMFADLSNLQICNVRAQVYARAVDYPPAVADVKVTAGATGTASWTSQVWDSGGQNFDYTAHMPGGGIDLTSQVGGDWNKLPSWLTVHASMSANTPPAGLGIVMLANSAAVWLHGADIIVTAHPNTVPC